VQIGVLLVRSESEIRVSPSETHEESEATSWTRSGSRACSHPDRSSVSPSSLGVCMANDVDPACSLVALATTKGDPELAVGEALANASMSHPPPPPLATDWRRTQSAADLSTQKPTTPTASAVSSPRHSLTESLSRSSSFLAAAISGANLNATPSNHNEAVHIITVVHREPDPLYVDLYSCPGGCGAFVKSFHFL
jgi:hypothetical protein